MLHLIHNHIQHFLCVMLLISRLGDIISTRLVTPKLTLEANPIVRKLGWKFAALTVFACLLPYYSLPASLMILVPFLLVSASNTGKIWMVRTLGEEEYSALLFHLARNSRLSTAILGIVVSASFIILAGLTLLVFYPHPNADWGYWFASGMIFYGLIIAFYGSLAMRRLFKKAALMEEPANEPRA